MKTYQSKTLQFPQNQLLMLQDYEAERLAAFLVNVSQVIALRAVAEVMLNEDWEKLHIILRDKALLARWRDFENDIGVDARDRKYAEDLEAVLLKMDE